MAHLTKDLTKKRPKMEKF